jgi:formate dehydrogenase major subunit
MELSRRDFLKASGAGMGLLVLIGKLGFITGPAAHAGLAPVLPKKIGEKTTICCFCGAGCGAIVSTYEDGIIKTEGDPDHPINEGGMCPKGQSIAQMHQVDGKLNPYRLTKPLYRAPNSSEFVEKSWDWMIDAIAHRVKDTRDKYWDASVNRVNAIGSLGGGELDNEECYLLSKMNRSLGIVYVEHCARL